MQVRKLFKGGNYSRAETIWGNMVPRRPRISINWSPPFQTQIYLVKVTLSVNIVKQDLLHRKTVFENFMKWSLKGGISIDTDSGMLRYALWCCGRRSQDFFTFIQIVSNHTVSYCIFLTEYNNQFRAMNLKFYKLYDQLEHVCFVYLFVFSCFLNH